MTGTNCDLFTHKSSRSYLNHLVLLLCKKNIEKSVLVHNQHSKLHTNIRHVTKGKEMNLASNFIRYGAR